MELAVCAAVVTIFNLLWTFYLHGKVQEKSLAAKTQRIIRDWKLGHKEAWEAEFNGGRKAAKATHTVVKATQRNYGDWTDWVCSCKHSQSSITTSFERDIQQHRNVQKHVGK